MSVGTEIRRRRQEQGLTGAQLAARAGLAPSAVSQIETGRRTPNSGSVVKLAEALGVQVGDLYPKATPSLFEIIEPHLEEREGQRRLKEEWNQGAVEGTPAQHVAVELPPGPARDMLMRKMEERVVAELEAVKEAEDDAEMSRRINSVVARVKQRLREQRLAPI